MTHRPLPADIVTMVRQRVGLSQRVLSRPETRRAFDFTLSRSGLRDELAYVRALRSEPSLFAELVDALTVSESYFLRDAQLFRFLGEEVVRRAGGPLALWSAGCAGGEELYSLAIVCEERGLSATTRFVGSDVAPAVVARARAAEYGAWSLRGVPPSVVARYFDALPGRRFRFTDRLARRASFVVHSLADDDPAPQRGAGFDVVLCRNVLMYLEPRVVEAAGRTLARALAPGGLLITGPSDPELPSELFGARAATNFGLVYALAPDDLSRRLPSIASAGVSNLPPVPAPVSIRPALPLPPRPTLQPQHAPASALVAAESELSVASSDPQLCAASHVKRAAELIDAGELSGAAEALRAALYLDASLSLAHLMSGWLCRLLGEPRAARAAFERVLASLAGMSGDQPVPLGDGLTVAELERIVRADLT